MASSGTRDGQWQAAFDAELAVWETLHADIQSVVVHDKHRETYDSLAQSAAILNEIAGEIRAESNNGNALACVIGVERIAVSMSYLFDANLFLQQEQGR